MRCRVNKTVASDIAAWVRVDIFLSYSDPDDLNCRESQIIRDFYHPNWFRQDDHGELYFTPPAFGFLNGRLRGVNGRHRAVLLCKHMTIIPMLLVETDTWPEEVLSKVIHKLIADGEMIELPDLPRSKNE